MYNNFGTTIAIVRVRVTYLRMVCVFVDVVSCFVCAALCCVVLYLHTPMTSFQYWIGILLQQRHCIGY